MVLNKLSDTIEFYVAGIAYTGYEGYAKTLQVGTPLQLIPEPEHEIDPNAIAVHCKYKIGYVPNSGYTCANCNAAIKSNSSCCPKCNSEEWIKGGLATRIKISNVLNKEYGCCITKVNQVGDRTDIFATLVT